MTEGTVDKPQLGLRRIIERPRLTRLLDESSARIKMLVAPAGYGKTTLARQWLAQQRLHSWLRLTSASADPAALIAQLAAGAATIEPRCSVRVQQRLGVTTEPEKEWRLLLEILIEDLARSDPAAWIGIDDYQTLATSHHSRAIIEAFVEQIPFGVLLLSRERPAWITTRMILYGEVTEIGRNALAMTYEEAGAAFGTDTRHLPGLVHLSDGWPAVLAIAALKPIAGDFPNNIDTLPESLYAYFAEELYSALEEPAARSLGVIALAGVEDLDVLRDLTDGDDEVIRRGFSGGWFTGDGSGHVEFHPLLRSFLCRKLEEDHGDEFIRICHRAGEVLIDHQHWDAAFRLIRTFSVDQLIAPLLESGWREMLRVGRVSTVREWVDHAAKRQCSTSHSALAKAEIAFLSGKFYESELAAAGIADLPGEIRLHAGALIVAGRAAHAASREEQALSYFRRARAVASTSDEESAAALGELSAAIDLELPEAVALLRELRRDAAAQTLEYRVSLTGKSIALAARFGLPPDFDEARNAYQLLSIHPDPISRTSFRNVFAYTLAMAGLTVEANAVLDDQQVDAQTFRIDFAHAYTDAVSALIALFEGRFDDVEAILSEIEAEARRRGDSFLLANTVCIRTRMLLSVGELNAAMVSAVRFVGASTASMRGEIEASYALALACAGCTSDATDTATRAAAATQSSEIAVMVQCVTAIVAIQRATGDAFVLTQAALQTAMRLGAVESFVTALRGFPDLGAILFEAPDTRQLLVPVLAACNELERYGGATTSDVLVGAWGDLSPREQEVLQLVAIGLTNRDIAKRLFIAESTVKVHVHSILAKLGAPSRTAAALRVPPFARLTQPAPERRRRS